MKYEAKNRSNNPAIHWVSININDAAWGMVAVEAGGRTVAESKTHVFETYVKDKVGEVEFLDIVCFPMSQEDFDSETLGGKPVELNRLYSRAEADKESIGKITICGDCQ